MTEILTEETRNAWNEECRAGRLALPGWAVDVVQGRITCCGCLREIKEHQKFKIIDRMRAAHLICEPA